MSDAGSLGPVAEVVLGASDPDAAAAFLAIFGLLEVDRVGLTEDESREIFRREPADRPALRLAAGGARDRATVLVVATDEVGAVPTAWQHGPRALDLYTTDLDVSVAAARAAGFATSPEALLVGGPMRMRQVMVTGPEGLPVVLVESTHRRASICDRPDGPLHSEPHSVVWCVRDHGEEVRLWNIAGWTAGVEIRFSEPSVSDELGLPERPTPITMTMLSDPEVLPVRVELLTFDDHRDAGAEHRDGPGAPPPAPVVPLRAGIHALSIDVRSISAAIAQWAGGARFGRTVQRSDGRAVVAGTTAGGVRIVLVERG